MDFLPQKLCSKLMRFQKDGILYAISKHGRCLIGDEMGLGKTLQAISVAWYYKTEWPVLIIVPSSLKYPWIEEIEKWLPEIDPNQINLIQGGADIGEITSSSITLVTYGLLRHPASKVVREALTNQKFKVIIVDESHYMKNRKSATSKFLVPLIQKAERKLLLTGTPALARPEELFPQLSALLPKEFGKFGQFAQRYCDARYQYFGKIRKWVTDGASNLEELQSILKNKVMIRRLKKDVLTQLPPKQRQRIPFEVKDSDMKKDLDTTWTELHKALGKTNTSLIKALGSNSSTDSTSGSDWFEVRKNISQLYHKTCSVKVGPVKDYIKMLCENQGLKFIVFAYHRVMINSLVDQLMDAGIQFIRIDGSTLQQDRPRLVHQFQVEKTTRVAVLSIKAAGVGLTLTAAKLVVFAELDWTPGALEQCEDRAHRIGQKDTVHIHYLVAKGTLDEWVWSALARKTTVVSTTLNGETQVLQMDTGNQGQIDCLTNAEAFKPSQHSQQENIEQFFNSQLPANQKTMLDFFTPGGTKRVSTSKSKRDLSIKPIVIDHLSDEEGNSSFLEFEAPKRKRQKKKSTLAIEDDKASSDLKSQGRQITNVHKQSKSDDEGATSQPHIVTEAGVEWSNVSKQMLQDVKTQIISGNTVENSVFDRDQLLCDSIENDRSNQDDGNGSLGIPLKTRQKLLDQVNNPPTGHYSTVKEFPQNKQFIQNGNAEKADIIILSDDDIPVVKSKVNHNSSEIDVLVERDQSPLSKYISDVSDVSMKEVDGVISVKSVVSETVNNKVWSCTACTFDNHGDLPYCEVCNTPQPKAKRPSRTSNTGENSILRKVKRRNVRKSLLSPTTPPQQSHNVERNVCKNVYSDIGDSSFEPSTSGANHDKNNLMEDITQCDSDKELFNQNKFSLPNDDGDDGTDESGNVLEITHDSDLKNTKPKNLEEEIMEYSSDEDLFDASKKSFRTNVKNKAQERLSNMNNLYTDDSSVDMSASSHSIYSSQSTIEATSQGLIAPSCNLSRNVYNSNKLETAAEVSQNSGLSPSENVSFSPVSQDEEMLKANRFTPCHKGIRYHDMSDEESTPTKSSQTKENPMHLPLGESNYSTLAMNENTRIVQQNQLTPCRKDRKIHDISDEEATPPKSCKTKAEVSPMCQSLDEIMAEESAAAQILFSPKSKKKRRLIDDPGGEDAVDAEQGEWVCVECDMLNAADVLDCDGCLASRPSQADLARSDFPQVKERTVNLDEVETFNLFKYRGSQNTNRIYLFRQDDSPLNVNFVPLDIEVGNYSELPDILLHPLNLKLVQRFVREWNSLSSTKRRVIIRSGHIFTNPAIAYEESRSKTRTCSRHLSKEVVSAAAVNKAEEVGGSVRHVVRPKYSPKRKRKRSRSQNTEPGGSRSCHVETEGCGTVDSSKDVDMEDSDIMVKLKGLVQAVDSEGRPLCVLCHKPYENELVTVATIKENPWHTRFCTRNCMHQYWLRSSRSYSVDQIFAEEHGCCQICEFEAHALFLRVKGTTDLQKRAKLIKNSIYNSLNNDFKEKMVKHPTKGLFWEVDHILPVSEGGGECDIDNLRTLCTPCHRKVTSQQARDRAKRRRLKEAAACGDITAFFQPK